MKRNSNRPKGGGNGSFLYVVGMHGNLVVCPHQIDLGVEGTTREVMGVIVDVTDGNGSDVKSSTVTTWMSTVVLLGHNMESRLQRPHGAASCAVSQYGVELSFGDG
jgi:hypothetical protein